MSGMYWLASYPKSGNTWVRAFLTNYMGEDDQPASINALGAGWTAAQRDALSDDIGLEASDLTVEQIAFYRHAMYEAWAERVSGPVFFKVHDAYTTLPDGRPAFPARGAVGAIYLVRNPLDVAVSYAHHRNKSVDDTISLMSRRDAVLDGTSEPGPQVPQVLQSWSDHVRSWVDAAGLQVHVVRYEDLLDQPHVAFRGIANFATLTIDERKLDRAIEFSSFTQLQSQETTLGFKERQPTSASFFRSGRAGAWREHLTTMQVRRVVADHGDMMQRFGYLPTTGESVC